MKLPIFNPNRPFRKLARMFFLAGCCLAAAFFAPLRAADPARQSARASVGYLRQVMDQFHNRFPVYDDVSSAGNHFHAYGKLPDQNAPVNINGSWTAGTHSGATSIRCEFTNSPGATFGGFYFQNGTLAAGQTAPQTNFGTVPQAGIDLTGATALTFWARGETGGESIEFFVAGVGRDATSGLPEPGASYPDSSPRQPALGTITTLTANWQKYTIDLTGLDLSYVLGGFAWVADATHNPGGAIFYLDDIQYELSQTALNLRLNQPRFLRSFTTLPLQPDPFDATKDGDIDFVLRNMAFSYDNALALLAFLADGTADGLRRARLIGDAFIQAAQHDRTYNDNRTYNDGLPPDNVNGARIRSAYAAGDIALPPGWLANGRTGTVPIPGFYSEATTTFYEVEQQAIDTGNNAWVMVALLALHQRTNDPAYLEMARKIGHFIQSFRNTAGQFQGFLGGTDSPEAAIPSPRPWASSEHNLDINAAFTRMFAITGDTQWRDDAQHARDFVGAMWETGRMCYLAGTTDPNTRNAAIGHLPLDVQAWSVLSLPDALTLHPEILRSAETQHRNSHDGFTGFDFNDDRDGVWFEGTAQMAVAYALAGEPASADSVRQQLRSAQSTPGFGDGSGLPASCHDGLSTGFSTAGGDPFKYFRRLHVGATAWNVFGQLGFNPYYLTSSTTLNTLRDLNVDGNADLLFQNNVGQIYVWYMNGSGGISSGAYLFTGALGDWKIAAIADLNGDGIADLLFQNNVGQIYLWYMDGNGGISSGAYVFTGDLGDWRIAAIADINGDGIADLIFQNTVGQIYVWHMDGSGGISSGAYLFSGGLGDWRVAGIADLNGDGNADVIFQNTAGQIYVWYMNAGGGVTSGGYLFTGALGDWRIKSTADLNGDGNADLIFQNTLGQIYVWYMDGHGGVASGGYIFTGGLGDWRLH
jgi:hypothetical protein